MSSRQLNSKDDRPVLIFKAISDHRHFFPAADLLLPRDGKDRHGLKIENAGPAITKFTIMTAN